MKTILVAESDNKIREELAGLLSMANYQIHIARNGKEAIEITKHNTRLTLILALSYSGRWEIAEAAHQIALDVQAGKLKPEEVTEQKFSAYLSTALFPDPELLIRTSGELRISNFLLWQIAYTELYITDTLWPDFRKKDLHEAIINYQKRERRFGKISEQVANQ